MAEGRAGPRAGPGRAGPGRAGPGRAEILEKLGGPGRAGPQFWNKINFEFYIKIFKWKLE